MCFYDLWSEEVKAWGVESEKIVSTVKLMVKVERKEKEEER